MSSRHNKNNFITNLQLILIIIINIININWFLMNKYDDINVMVAILINNKNNTHFNL